MNTFWSHFIKAIALIILLSNFFPQIAYAKDRDSRLISIKDYRKLDQLSGDNLKSAIRLILSENYNSHGYKKAKKIIYTKLDNSYGEVCCVYGNKCLRTNKVPRHTIMNVEHTWPQSKGAKGIAASDLHHLFPTASKLNSKRSSFPFCDVDKVKWEGELSKFGKDDRGVSCFEPPQEHKGNVARALFYFSIRYRYKIEKNEEETLRRWHEEDPVDFKEIERNQKVFNYQRNSNIFIEYPEIVDRVDNF